MILLSCSHVALMKILTKLNLIKLKDLYDTDFFKNIKINFEENILYRTC